MLFTSYCAGCNQPGATLCRRCRFSLASAKAQVSDGGVLAPLPFEGVARQVVHGLKYRNRRQVATVLAGLMVRRLRTGKVDVVTWAPTSGQRSRRRGYDQAELLARAVAHELGVPCRRLLYRRHGPEQTGHTRAERLHGPAFRARPVSSRLRVLLVDDVVTTGATLAAASEALRSAGIGSVVCVAAAATPARSAQSIRPAQRRTAAMASVGSASTTAPRIPTPSAAATFEGTSSRKAVRSGWAPSLARAS
jgi:predicted amidophosphoribosyltransferase